MIHYINITQQTIDSAIQTALNESLIWLKATHPFFTWQNRTGLMERSISFHRISDDEWEFVIDVNYAGAVDYWKPYINILVDHVEQILIERIEQSFNN